MNNLSQTFSSYYELTKPYIVKYCVASTLCGVLFVSQSFNIFFLLIIILGVACIMSSAGAFNQIIGRKADKLMKKRTAHRPLPSGRLKTQHATLFAFVLFVLDLMSYGFM